jgi:hypothetical protein
MIEDDANIEREGCTLGAARQLVGRAWRRARRTLRAAALDMRSGRLLGGTRPSRFAQYGAIQTQSTPYEALEAIFAAVPIASDDVLVDVGCGKGRVIHWWLMRGLRNRMIGLEIDPDVAATTARSFRRHANVEIRVGDALTALPREGTIWYLFNPFNRDATARFTEALLQARHDRGAVVVFFNLHHADLFAPPRWKVETVSSPSGIYGPMAVIRLLKSV